MTEAVWQTKPYDPRKISLDHLNPRIEVASTASQDTIRLKLLELEDVLELARNIEKNGGLFYGERIICVEENGSTIVLEGNRRVAACQMLLRPALIPENFKARFPIASAATKTRIKMLEADVAPDRAAAEPILTKRHTEQSAKPWSPVAKMRRAVRLLEKHSVDEVAQLLGTSPAQVKKLIRPFKLLKFALSLKCWSEGERKSLENEKLITNPYTRLFTLADTKRALQLHFDDDQNAVSALPKKQFTKEMERIARDFLLPDPANGKKPKFDTRANVAEYFSDLLAQYPNAPTTPNQTGPTPTKGTTAAKTAAGRPASGEGTQQASNQQQSSQPKTPRASVFFENLECHVNDDNLLALTNEIRSVNHIKRPIAASLLLRSLFECSLRYKIHKEKKFGELIAQLKAKNPQSKRGWDPALNDFITFAENFNNGVFEEKNICKTLASGTTKAAKDYLDAITHVNFVQVDVPTLLSVSNNIRQIVKYILDGK